MRKLIMVLMLVVMANLSVAAQERFQGYLGYQYTRSGFEFEDFDLKDTVEAHGVNASATVFAGSTPGPLGLTGEIAGNFKRDELDVSVVTLMGGVTLQKRTGRVQPFGRGLIGAARVNEDGAGGGSDIGLAWAIGGGLDVKVRGRFALRLFQVDYLRTRNFDTPVNHLRLGAGIRF